MQTITTAAEMWAYAQAERAAGRRLALVPTMGALHAGHLALVAAARPHADRIIVSIFVNPTQFGPNEDFQRYPRTLDADRTALAEVGGVDVVFAPGVEDMYPPTTSTWVEVADMDRYLCGPHRPGHFRGVTTIVTKLFNICQPHVAIFGLKDAQQFLMLERMVSDLGMDVALIGVPTVREPDGLALSSRNVYLSPEERTQAAVLNQALHQAKTTIQNGVRDGATIEAALRAHIETAPLADIQYAQIVDRGTLHPVETIKAGQALVVALAVFFGKTRLIDNVFVEAKN